MANSPRIWTIGHSNLELEVFDRMLLDNGIEFVVDVRSYPYSGFVPHFDREALSAHLPKKGIRYLYLGGPLGGRPDSDDHYDDQGHALYGPMSREPEFIEAIKRLETGAREHRIAILCSCGKLEDCHRRLLVGKVLADHGVELRHILKDSGVEVEREVQLDPGGQGSLFSEESLWRSTQSVSHRQRLSTSSAG